MSTERVDKRAVQSRESGTRKMLTGKKPGGIGPPGMASFGGI